MLAVLFLQARTGVNGKVFMGHRGGARMYHGRGDILSP